MTSLLERMGSQLETSRLLEPNQTYILAVSGGLDSVVLLDLLSRLAGEWGWQLVVAHLDHAQRPDSYADAVFVGQLADQLGHRFIMDRLRAEPSSEDKLRRSRADWLERMRTAQDAAAILTAHHQNDRLETAVWHAIRGSDRTGLTSLRSRSGQVIRPLLGFTRGELLAYAHGRDLTWHEDSTNTDRSYTRNLIRHELLHPASSWDVDYHKNLRGWLDHLESVNTTIDSQLDHLTEKISRPQGHGRSFVRAGFLKFSPVVQAALLAHWARGLTAGKGLTTANLTAALGWLATAPTGTFTEALPGLLLIREYDTVQIVPRHAPAESDANLATIPLPLHQTVRYGHLQLTLLPRDATAPAGPLLAPGDYFVRSWQAGDRVQPIGMTGSKKVQDVFVDSKVPRRQRLAWPLVVTSASDIAVIPGLVRDRRFTSTDHPAALTLRVEEMI